MNKKRDELVNGQIKKNRQTDEQIHKISGQTTNKMRNDVTTLFKVYNELLL